MLFLGKSQLELVDWHSLHVSTLYILVESMGILHNFAYQLITELDREVRQLLNFYSLLVFFYQFD